MRGSILPFARMEFMRSESGTTAIEYAMIACFIFVAIVGAVQTLGNGIVNTLYNKLVTLF